MQHKSSHPLSSARAFAPLRTAALAFASAALFAVSSVVPVASGQTFEPFRADTSDYDVPAFRIVDVYPQPNPGCLRIAGTSVDTSRRPIRVTLELKAFQSCDIPGGIGGLITNQTIGFSSPLPAGTYEVEFGYAQDGVWTHRKSTTLVVDDGHDKCGRTPEGNWLTIEPTSGVALERIAAVVADPALDPVLHEQLERPIAVHRYITFGWLDLKYPPLDDARDLKRRLEAKRSEIGIGFVEANDSALCFIPTYEPVAWVEFYNANLGHYFMTEDAAEIASIDGGGSGPGWQRTGETIPGIKGDNCHPYAPNATPLYRFYGTRGLGPNSHFFTADRRECGAVRRDPGWTFETSPFRVYAPVAGVCTERSTPVHRL